MASTSGEEPPLEESSPLLSLPKDLLLNCLSRVPRWELPRLSLVSKSFRSLVASRELHDMRSVLGHTEHCLYVYLRMPSELFPRWFALRPGTAKPFLPIPPFDFDFLPWTVLADVPLIVPIPPFHSDDSWAVVAGTDICIASTNSPTVSILDCWSHTWRNMTSRRFYGPEEDRRQDTSKTVCSVNDVWYCIGGDKVLRWHDKANERWQEVKCAEEMPGFPLQIHMANRGGRLAVLWDEVGDDDGRFRIWCTEISLERRNGGEIWGKVHSSHVVSNVGRYLFSFISDPSILHFLSVTV